MATPQGLWYVIGKIFWIGKDRAIKEKRRIFNRYSIKSYTALAHQLKSAQKTAKNKQ